MVQGAREGVRRSRLAANRLAVSAFRHPGHLYCPGTSIVEVRVFPVQGLALDHAGSVQRFSDDRSDLLAVCRSHVNLIGFRNDVPDE